MSQEFIKNDSYIFKAIVGHSTYRKTITQRLPIIIGYVVVHHRIPSKIGFSLGKSHAPTTSKKLVPWHYTRF